MQRLSLMHLCKLGLTDGLPDSQDGDPCVSIRAQQPVSAGPEEECSAALVVLLPLCKWVLRLLLLLLHLSKVALPAFDAAVAG